MTAPGAEHCDGGAFTPGLTASKLELCGLRVLASQPDKRVSGPGSDGSGFSWFIDQVHGQMLQVGVISVSLWWYKIAILVRAL